MEPISVQEIEYASRILFNGDSTKFFDDILEKKGERVEAIQCLESRPIVACPGSGKTTVLLAKLIILSNRMPFDDGRGICVLTHTNVAIDLIKEKLGVGASRLFAYPNFFGTIQSFINKFLAIPCYVNTMGFRPIIDIDQFNEKIKIDYEKVNYLPKGWINPRGGFEYLQRLCFNMENPEIISNGLLGDSFAPIDKDYYQKIKRFKENICKYGYVSFNEAFTLANSYINKHHQIVNAFQERFKFVFIDEMQDTAIHQSNIINQLFKGSDRTIVQELGDPNQAIYDYDGQKGNWEIKNPLFLQKSKRFGINISKLINPLRVDPEEWVIIGENTASTLPPYLFIYDETKRSKLKMVFNEFGKLIVENELHIQNENKKPIFVAIGRVGKENEMGNITLKTYWENFEKVSTKAKEYFPTLIEYLGKELPLNKVNYSERIINAILHFLDIHDFKNEIEINKKKVSRKFSKTTFFDFLEKEDENLFYRLRDKIANWSLMIKTEEMAFNTNVSNSMIKFLSEKILVFKGKLLNNQHPFLKNQEFFLTNSNLSSDNSDQEDPKSSNIYFYKFNEREKIPIKINTIHGEKGKTHSATLYLETYKDGSYDSLMIQKQLEGKSYKKSYSQNVSKLAYVAMSRPERLLCFAVSSKRISEEYALRLLKPLGWEIITI